MILFSGNGNVLRGDDVVRFGPLRMWAERGLVHIEDSRDNSYDTVSVRVCLQRMRALSDMLGNKTVDRQKNSTDQFDGEFRRRNTEMLEAMTEVCRRAQIQGMPDDASARRDLVRRRAKTVVVPGYGGGL